LRLFGFEIKRKKELENQNVSFIPKVEDDGSLLIQAGFPGGGYSTSVDLDGTIRTEAELVSKYRLMA
jgi:hypothetical protein